MTSYTTPQTGDGESDVPCAAPVQSLNCWASDLDADLDATPSKDATARRQAARWELCPYPPTISLLKHHDFTCDLGSDRGQASLIQNLLPPKALGGNRFWMRETSFRFSLRHFLHPRAPTRALALVGALQESRLIPAIGVLACRMGCSTAAAAAAAAAAVVIAAMQRPPRPSRCRPCFDAVPVARSSTRMWSWSWRHTPCSAAASLTWSSLRTNTFVAAEASSSVSADSRCRSCINVDIIGCEVDVSAIIYVAAEAGATAAAAVEVVEAAILEVASSSGTTSWSSKSMAAIKTAAAAVEETFSGSFRRLRDLASADAGTAVQKSYPSGDLHMADVIEPVEAAGARSTSLRGTRILRSSFLFQFFWFRACSVHRGCTEVHFLVCFHCAPPDFQDGSSVVAEELQPRNRVESTDSGHTWEPPRPSVRGCNGGILRGAARGSERHGAHESARYGLRARRIGEALRPGPALNTRECPPLGADAKALALRPDNAAKTGAGCIAELARKIGVWPSDGTIPNSAHRQKWSDVNNPLIWAAAAGRESHALLDWLEIMCEGASVSPRRAWRRLRECFRDWGIHDTQQLSPWAEREGLGPVRHLAYLPSRVQEYIIHKAELEDPLIEDLSASYLVATFQLSHDQGFLAELLANLRMRSRSDQPSETAWVPIMAHSGVPQHLPQVSLRAHELTHAAEEMRRAGVGSRETESLSSGVGAGHAGTGGRRARRAGELLHTLGPAPFRPAPRQPRREFQPVDRLPAEPPAAAWESLDVINLRSEFLRRRQVLKACPRAIRGRYRHAQRIALEAIDASHRGGTELDVERAWKLFGLLSIMLLHRSPESRSVDPQELEERCAAFARGEWLRLIVDSRPRLGGQARRDGASAEAEERRRQEMACAKVRLEECSKARQVLVSSAIAPGTPATLRELEASRQTHEQPTLLPDDVLNFVPRAPVDVPFKLFVAVLKASPRGSAAGPGDTTNELLKIALDDEDTAKLLHHAVLRMARAEIPSSIAEAFMAARMTALLKPNGRVRGIATGTAFRRLVASCLARVAGAEVERACAPFQYALSTRAGTECVGHLFRAACDLNPNACVLSIDGIGAFDNISRKAMLQKLASLPTASSIVPFARLSYASPTDYVWTDDAGRDHTIRQNEGGEQGDPLMPLLFALGIHDALKKVSERLHGDEDLCAFLDDVYLLCSPERVRTLHDALSEALAEVGIQLHTGKTRVWNKAGQRPPRIDDLGGEAGAWSPRGVVLLGVPVGAPEFVEEHTAERLREERLLLSKLSNLPDPQCAWQLLTRCAVPRGNYWLRTLPPSMSQTYASQRDEALWAAMLKICQAESVPPELQQSGRRIAQLPSRMGGLGIRSGVRLAPAAYWASWADSLAMIQKRNPRIAENILRALEGNSQDGCLYELASAAHVLRREGYNDLPSWADLANGKRPPRLPQGIDAVERTPGWQYFASSQLDRTERTRLLLTMCRSARASLRSQSGLGASHALSAAPTCRECTLQPEVFQALIRRRLRWPLPLSCARCHGCRNELDHLGDHFNACMQSGRVKLRATPSEHMVAQICREAGARVRPNVLLRDLNLAVDSADERRIEVIASGLPVFGGSQLAIDVTLRSPLRRDGSHSADADWLDGAAAARARADKERKYPELATGARCRLVVLAVETGGRFSDEVGDFLRQLAQAKSISAPWYFRASTAAAFERRWSRMLAVCVATSCMEALLLDKDELANVSATVGREPWLQDLLTESRDMECEGPLADPMADETSASGGA